VITALIIGHVSGTVPSGASSSPSAGVALPAVTVAAPPPADAATQAACLKVLEQLPTRVDGLDARQVVSSPSSPFVVGWGDPAVVLRCGVARPKDLVPGSSSLYVSASGAGGPYYDVTSSGNDQIYTAVDRAVYIEISIPAKYSSGPLPALSEIIAGALPAVCAGGVAPGTLGGADLCDQRP
jgi:hypothetical protein